MINKDWGVGGVNFISDWRGATPQKVQNANQLYVNVPLWGFSWVGTVDAKKKKRRKNQIGLAPFYADNLSWCHEIAGNHRKTTWKKEKMMFISNLLSHTISSRPGLISVGGQKRFEVMVTSFFFIYIHVSISDWDHLSPSLSWVYTTRIRPPHLLCEWFADVVFDLKLTPMLAVSALSGSELINDSSKRKKKKKEKKKKPVKSWHENEWDYSQFQ